MDFWALLFLCFKFSPFSSQNSNFCFIHCTVSGIFLHIFGHWQRLFCPWKENLKVYTSCKTSCNVLSHLAAGSVCAHVGRGVRCHSDIRGWQRGRVVQQRESSDFGSPEVGISANRHVTCEWERQRPNRRELHLLDCLRRDLGFRAFQKRAPFSKSPGEPGFPDRVFFCFLASSLQLACVPDV